MTPSLVRQNKSKAATAKRLAAWWASFMGVATIALALSTAMAPAFGQTLPSGHSNSPYTGYTNDGTLFMAGQMIGNPHQILHDVQNQALFDVQATRFTNTTDAAFGQGTLAQMETHMTQLLPTQGNELFTRMYVSPVNPYPQTPIGAFNNYVTYDEVIANSQQASYQLTVANDNNLWAFKTLAAPNNQAMNILIKELPAHQNFIANSDPMGGAVGVKVNSNGDAAALQNYFATTLPYDFSWRSAMGPWANGTARPNNVSSALGDYAGAPIGNNEAGAVFFNWVMGSNQVQQYTGNLQAQSQATGNESFGVLAWDSNQNQYVMLAPTNVSATPESVSGTMPTPGDGQTAFFGMHTHPGDATPSQQDYVTTQYLGLDQAVVGNNGQGILFATNSSNNWTGKKFKFNDYATGTPDDSPHYGATNPSISDNKNGRRGFTFNAPDLGISINGGIANLPNGSTTGSIIITVGDKTINYNNNSGIILGTTFLKAGVAGVAILASPPGYVAIGVGLGVGYVYKTFATDDNVLYSVGVSFAQGTYGGANSAGSYTDNGNNYGGSDGNTAPDGSAINGF
jgi:hypothetical protein